MNAPTNERLEREFKVTEKALDHIKISIDKNDKSYNNAIHFLDTAKRYYEDAKYFKSKGDILKNTQVREKGIILKQHCHRTFLRRKIYAFVAVNHY